LSVGRAGEYDLSFDLGRSKNVSGRGRSKYQSKKGKGNAKGDLGRSENISGWRQSKYRTKAYEVKEKNDKNEIWIDSIEGLEKEMLEKIKNFTKKLDSIEEGKGEIVRGKMLEGLIKKETEWLEENYGKTGRNRGEKRKSTGRGGDLELLVRRLDKLANETGRYGSIEDNKRMQGVMSRLEGKIAEILLRALPLMGNYKGKGRKFERWTKSKMVRNWFYSSRL
jgi:hypothetical protein